MNEDWDVNKIDRERKCHKTVINLCARKGNAKAVALLIQHGADISKGVLHEIVRESVVSPQKIDILIDVYQVIVDNAVIWRELEEKTEFRTLKGTDKYAEKCRTTMIWLLTSRVNADNEELYEKRDVLEYALAHGASEMFSQIINTKPVFRTNYKKIWKCEDDRDDPKNGNDNGTPKINVNSEENANDRDVRKWAVFDVTNFTAETHLKANDHNLKSESDEKADGNQNTWGGSAKLEQKRNFEELPTPKHQYLATLLSGFDEWKSSNIFNTPPFKQLTKRHVALSKRLLTRSAAVVLHGSLHCTICAGHLLPRINIQYFHHPLQQQQYEPVLDS